MFKLITKSYIRCF